MLRFLGNRSLKHSDSQLAFSKSLTPADWPFHRSNHDLTNKPAKHGGLGLYLLHLVRIGGDDVQHSFFDGAGIGHLLEPTGLTMSLGLPPSVQTISNTSLAICRKSSGPGSGRRFHRAVRQKLVSNQWLSLSLLRRPKSSLITQFAAILPSRPLATCSKKCGGGAFGSQDCAS